MTIHTSQDGVTVTSKRVRTIPTQLTKYGKEQHALEQQAVIDELVEACNAGIAYDKALQSCGNSPDKMSSFCTALGDDLDALYMDWIKRTKQALDKATQ